MASLQAFEPIVGAVEIPVDLALCSALGRDHFRGMNPMHRKPR
jgi:hypothetical protein